jgi:malonate transporter
MGHRQVTHDPRLYHSCVLRNGARLPRWLDRDRDIDNHHVAELNALVMDFALPASLFVAMVQTPRSLLLEQGQLMIVLAVSMLAIYGLHFWLQRSLLKLDSRQASVESLTTGLPNLASAGLPLISSVFGAANTVSVGTSTGG